MFQSRKAGTDAPYGGGLKVTEWYTSYWVAPRGIMLLGILADFLAKLKTRITVSRNTFYLERVLL